MSSSRILLVCAASQRGSSGGRELLSGLIRDTLLSLYQEKLSIHELRAHAFGALKTARLAAQGYLNGLDPEQAVRIASRVASEKTSIVFLDGSNFGALARRIAQLSPGTTVVTFCHNVEARFFWGSLKHRRSPMALLVLAANFVAERAAVKHSDILICLNERDSLLFKRLYGRCADAILPLALKDPGQKANAVSARADSMGEYVLFVGGAFYANAMGIRWFAEKVAPQLPVRTCVIGRGLSAMAAELERFHGVEVVGEVETLEPWYRNAKLVVAPIFDGSGMKTKVAEALMYGKRIVGTKEAFCGYEEVQRSVGLQCTTASEFTKAILDVLDSGPPPFDVAMRNIYEERFSETAARKRLAKILETAERLPKAQGI